MNIVLLGANGRTGRLVIKQALAGGHTVTGLVRSADSLGEFQHDRLMVQVGDVTDPTFLTQVFPGHDAVISTVGPRTPRKAHCRIYSDSAAAIVAAMRATGVKRVLVTSTALLFPPSGVFDRVLRMIAKNNQNAAAVMEATIRDADLDYTFARPGFLSDGDDPGYMVKQGAKQSGGRSVSRLALANFLVTELERPAHMRQIVGLYGAESS